MPYIWIWISRAYRRLPEYRGSSIANSFNSSGVGWVGSGDRWTRSPDRGSHAVRARRILFGGLAEPRDLQTELPVRAPSRPRRIGERKMNVRADVDEASDVSVVASTYNRADRLAVGAHALFSQSAGAATKSSSSTTTRSDATRRSFASRSPGRVGVFDMASNLARGYPMGEMQALRSRAPRSSPLPTTTCAFRRLDCAAEARVR